MASSHKYFALALFAVSIKFCYCQNETIDAGGWGTAGVTWYGEPEGAGSTGGACGYGSAVANPPLYAMVSAGGPSLFNSGSGCGACYRIVCSARGNPACSGRPITVTITDECPGCSSEAAHFDLSGRAMGALAKPGQAYQLRSAGVLRVYYRRTKCLYRGTNIAFRMDAGANPYYIAFVVEYEDGDGDLAYVEIQPAGGNFMPMQEMRSAVWKINSGSALSGPFNIRLTSRESHKVVVAYNVIPAYWKPDETYRSIVNFH
ncbi:PREDICTED: expansin-B4-like [Camelina sativa]|uniref:Expansin-B4-like n=1 Tax=Camelina sativa TaxID=90675 RepID=A0ABM0ZAQ4_CAMSA|nr:PREDICTED: expansin-B4-like [Camelina sativa]